MKSRFLPLFLTLALSLCLASCKEQLPEGVMDSATMTDFLTEAYLLEGFYAVESGHQVNLLSDEVKASYEQLLEKFGITDADFEHSTEYYTRHLDEYENIHKEVLERLTKLSEEE